MSAYIAVEVKDEKKMPDVVDERRRDRKNNDNISVTHIRITSGCMRSDVCLHGGYG
jgi:hypothetical protein